MVDERDNDEESEACFCSECGAEVAEDARICPKCGVELDEEPVDEDEHPEEEEYTQPKELRRRRHTRDGVGLCPFSWIEVTKGPGCLSSIFGGKPQDVWEPQPCMQGECQLWDELRSDCGLRHGA